MEPSLGQDCEFSEVVETLTSMFGNIISRDVIVAVVESYEGDLSYAVEAIMNISSDIVTSTQPENIETMGNTTPGVNEQQRQNPPPESNPSSQPAFQPSCQPVIQPSSQSAIQPSSQHASEISCQDASQPASATSCLPSTTQPISYSQVTVQPSICQEFSPRSEPVFNPADFAPDGTLSYTGASQSTGAVPKQLPKPMSLPSNVAVWTDQLRLIMNYHNQGFRILLLMRGAPGSGKSYLAKSIIDMTVGATYDDHKHHIFSTDDYFIVRGQYRFDKSRLPKAHAWNQHRVCLALKQGLSPVIVDNTNIELWEMEPYVKEGVRNGYIIEVVEPNTPWAKKVGHLLRRNNHNVPGHTIKRMLENYQDGITGDFLIRYYGLSYPGQKVPPVLRNFPVFTPPNPAPSQPELISAPPITYVQRDLVYIPNQQPQQVYQNKKQESNPPAVYIPDQQPQQVYQNQEQESKAPVSQKNEAELHNEVENMRIDVENTTEGKHQQIYNEIHKQLEEFEKVEQEWENGESWDEEAGNTASYSKETTIQLGPRPPRRTTSESSAPTQSISREKFIDTVKKCDDWRKIALLMPSWADENPQEKEQKFPVRDVEKISSSTCMEIGDTDLNNSRKVLKIISATPRDINIYHIPRPEKMPERRMLDKSTTTNEMLIIEAFRCKNEEQHFVAFRKLFKNVPRAALRDIFDKCCGDVNWAVEIVLGSMSENQQQLLEGADLLSDTEDDIPKQEQCNCLAAYQVGIDQSESQTTKKAQIHTGNTIEQNIPIITNDVYTPLKKAKVASSDTSLRLKSEFERNFVIPDEHYSSHVIKLKNWRHGKYLDENSELNTDVTSPAVEELLNPQPSMSKETAVEHYDNNKQIKDETSCRSDDEESDTGSFDDVEKTIPMYLGHEFITRLDNLFGRRGMTYPANVEPKINIPVSLLNEINAFWMESLMFQLDEQDKQTNKMMKEDEEFAKQLALKEAELAQKGIEPEVPDFKEIMDMDFALSLYQKDVAGWKNKAPNDIAAKMSRDKLYNLFPDMSQDILSELLMAHDNNFQATVEVLLMSTGRADILEVKNGLNKFVMEKEMERREKILLEEKKALSRVEWPLLPTGEKVEMETVDRFREEAEKHLLRRNMNYQKAQDYIQRGMTGVANHFNEVAAYHKTRYEQINSMAAATLIQVHAANSPDNATIDLHYLRVAEAKESLDLFLDTHIQTLRENAHKGVRVLTLFFITGRGLHSNGRPRVKPAVKKRLRERGLACSERNPGLLTARVSADDKLTYQLE